VEAVRKEVNLRCERFVKQIGSKLGVKELWMSRVDSQQTQRQWQPCLDSSHRQSMERSKRLQLHCLHSDIKLKPNYIDLVSTDLPTFTYKHTEHPVTFTVKCSLQRFNVENYCNQSSLMIITYGFPPEQAKKKNRGELKYSGSHGKTCRRGKTMRSLM